MNHGELDRAAPVWNSLSLSTPFVGFVCGVVAGLCAPHFQWFERGFSVWFGFGVPGLLFGVFALVRAERLWGLTLAGLILNSVLVLMLVAWVIAPLFTEPAPPVFTEPAPPVSEPGFEGR